MRSNTTEYYTNGKKVAEKRHGGEFYLYDEDIETSTTTIKRWRKYDRFKIDNNLMTERYERIRKMEIENQQIEQENNQMRLEYDKAKQQAQVTARQRAESKVKKPTMQDIKKARETGKDATIQYIKNLTAQVEKELQIEISKIQAPQFKQKKTQAIP